MFNDRKTSMQIRDRVVDVPIESLISSVATKGGMGGGTIAAVYGWLTSSGAAMLVGILVTVAGFIVNLIYQRRRDAREERELAIREQRDGELHAARLLQIKHSYETQDGRHNTEKAA